MERTPLNTEVVEVVRKKGFRIEKLVYESLPGLYVPANLYVPDHIEKPAAAILYAGGHSGAYAYRNQIFPRKFMEEGFVCLVIGTLQFGEVQGVHHGCYSKGWFHWYSRGYNPGGVELWNAIRGLDLLGARPELVCTPGFGMDRTDCCFDAGIRCVALHGILPDIGFRRSG